MCVTYDMWGALSLRTTFESSQHQLLKGFDHFAVLLQSYNNPDDSDPAMSYCDVEFL